eukprot:CCRYP_010986-RA/>CCRYP_010986-RA protein AED:0.46 eAED:0.47 QI:0/0/0/1/0/0/3/0/219
MRLTLRVEHMSVIRRWVDALYNTHHDCRGQTGAMMSLGKGVVMSFSRKQKLNVQSSSEGELVWIDDALPWILWSTTQSTTFIARHREKLRAMSSVKAISEGLKWVECERGVGGKNSPIRYIPEQDPVQDALAKDKKTTYFKLTLPNTGNELKVALWASGTPEQFLLHVRSAIHACKQMGLDTDFAAAEKDVETAKIEAELAKHEYVTVRNAEKKKKGNK